jgi:hypothetical protein
MEAWPIFFVWTDGSSGGLAEVHRMQRGLQGRASPILSAASEAAIGRSCPVCEWFGLLAWMGRLTVLRADKKKRLLMRRYSV